MLASQLGQSFKESLKILFNPWHNCRLLEGNLSRTVQRAIQITDQEETLYRAFRTKQFSMILRSFCCLLKPAEQFICVKLFPKIPSYPKNLSKWSKKWRMFWPQIFSLFNFFGEKFFWGRYFLKNGWKRENSKKNFFLVLFWFVHFLDDQNFQLEWSSKAKT